MKIADFKLAKNSKKISMVTCYDASFAQAVENSDVDAVLVGDSVAMVVYGYEDTVSATLPMIERHTRAVRSKYKGSLVADIPFLTAQKSQTDFINDVCKLMQAGANAVKVEGVHGLEGKISSLVHAGVPVMGHVGLTPQFVNTFGGFKVQGRSSDSEEFIFKQALKLQDLGCFALVLECIPETLSKKISEELSITTIGIGAGLYTDGQILVLQDLIGLSEWSLKFVKKYDQFGRRTVSALNAFCKDVKSKNFPQIENTFL